MKPCTNSKSIENGFKARGDFNDFLNRAVKTGAISVQHMRVRARQPATEAFARKAVFAIKQAAPATTINFSVNEQKPPCTLDSSGLGEATAQFMGSADPVLTRYLGKPVSNGTAGLAGIKEYELSNMDLFALLNSYSGFEVAKRLSAAPSLGSGAVSIASGMGHLADNASSDVKNAADSVYAQSFADVHAISLRAAFDGNEKALTTLKEVMEIREAGGDFGKYSLAPLSHDTRTAIEILRSQLSNGKNFGAMTRDELWDNSRWAAAEGVAAWMQGHGVENRDASTLTVGLDAVHQIVSKASDAHRMSISSRQVMRPAA